jgi:hypothetical protein
MKTFYILLALVGLGALAFGLASWYNPALVPEAYQNGPFMITSWLIGVSLFGGGLVSAASTAASKSHSAENRACDQRPINRPTVFPPAGSKSEPARHWAGGGYYQRHYGD